MTIASAIHPPRTLLEVYKNLPEGTLVQLIENKLIMSPAPLYLHQKILMEISTSLFDLVKQNKLGEVVVAPIDVYFDGENVFQPDIIFISNERLNIIEEDGLHGAPDLIIEILSPSNAQYDQKEKKKVYERYGVKEYWIIDPTTKAAQGFYLNNNIYVEIGKEEGIIRSFLLNKELKF